MWSIGKFETRWTILGNTAKSWIVKCKCECGTTRNVRTDSLLTGKSRSCGCLQKEAAAKTGHARRKVGNTSAVNSKVTTYKRAAKARGLTWNLSREEFLALTTADCIYCGGSPKNVSKSRVKALGGNFLYNGIDRIDSSKGYTLANVVPACKRCNIAKSNMSIEEWVGLIRRVNNRLPIWRKLILDRSR